MGKNKDSFVADQVVLRIPFWPFAVVMLCLPSLSLGLCLITAVLFRYDDVNDTMCDVQNFIPSVSAVTGITPQTYLWRMGIALHCGPRLVVSALTYNRYQQRAGMGRVGETRRGLFQGLVRLNFILNVVENLALACVTFISNKENYPVHEKLFIVFMVSTLTFMLTNIFCFRMSCESPMTPDEEKSYFWKKTLFGITMAATAGLLYFFCRHRLLCEPGAFSYFSLCEYVIAYSSMLYHFTAYIEFKDKVWVVASPVQHGGAPTINNTTNTTNTTDNNNHVSKASSSSSSAGANPSSGGDQLLRNRRI